MTKQENGIEALAGERSTPSVDEVMKEMAEALNPFAGYACSPVGQCNCNNCRARDALLSYAALSKGDA